MYKDLNTFRFWCQKVLPLVYDDSLSYYEVLCKVVDYINNLIAQDKVFDTDISALKSEIKKVQEWIDNYDTSFAEKIITEHLGKMILVGITDNGYVVYSIPESWNDIQFNTTGLDINLPIQPNYGHLVLSY